MAAFAGMKTKPQLDAELDRMARMLPPWLERLRHPAQFWPQFDALAQEILADAVADDRAHVLQRLDAMLIDNEMPSEGRERWQCPGGQGIAAATTFPDALAPRPARDPATRR